MTRKDLKDIYWVSWRIFLEGVICFSVFYWFKLRFGIHRAGSGFGGFLKAIFFFTLDKVGWVVFCFYMTWIFHWFYFWIRMRDHIYQRSADKVFWGSVISLGVLSWCG